MSASEFTYLEQCTVIYRTEKAVRISYDGEDTWFPLSVISDIEDIDKKMGKAGVTVGIKTWFLRQQGWEGLD